MQPLADRVLIKVEETADVTVGGVVLPEAAKERPLMGKIETMTPSHTLDLPFSLPLSPDTFTRLSL
jgi:co-chaperonin GroES (HSP10)